jgi:hypothetical protein
MRPITSRLWLDVHLIGLPNQEKAIEQLFLFPVDPSQPNSLTDPSLSNTLKFGIRTQALSAVNYFFIFSFLSESG